MYRICRADKHPRKTMLATDSDLEQFSKQHYALPNCCFGVYDGLAPVQSRNPARTVLDQLVI
jgi:hypothetical protein